MVYLETFSFPNEDQEWDFVMSVKRTCYASKYPFQVLSRHRLERIDFEPVTILHGGNGSGKSTALNVMAYKLDLMRDAAFNDTCFFPDYAALCRMRLQGTLPQKSRIITSDDVFDAMLGLRAMNSSIDDQRNALFQTYREIHRSDFHFQLRSMEDYEELVRVNRARRHTQSRFVREELGTEIRTFSNGESAFRRFANEIDENALYLLDEPENSLSAGRQKELARLIEDSARFFGCQFVIATHSPFILAIRGAKIYDLDADPVDIKRWTALANVREMYAFFREHRAELEEASEK